MAATEAETSRDRAASAGRPARCRSATTNRPLAGRTSQRTAAGRRVADLFRAFLAAMNNPVDPISQANALGAAELAVAVEQQRLRAARGDNVDVDALVRLSNLADRAAKRLNLSRRREPSTAPLRERLSRGVAE